MNSPLELSLFTAEKAQTADLGYVKLLAGCDERSVQTLLTWARSEYDKEDKNGVRATMRTDEKKLSENKGDRSFLQAL